ncbi:MAG: hypothetical protein ACR2NF_08040, partial [Pirellulales bacterium]
TQDNMDDMIKAGRCRDQSGEKGNCVKLSEAEAKLVIEMLNRFPPTKSQHSVSTGICNFLGRWFDVHLASISAIHNLKSWKHLDRGAA